MRKIFFKTLIISLAFWQAVFTTALPLAVYAEESTTITTGDATSDATAQSSANTTDTEVPGSLTGEGCGPETTCPTDTEVQTDQEAITDTSSSGTSETGQNEATTSGDLLIDTGNADSQATTGSTANINAVELASENPSPTPESGASPEPSPSPTPEATLDVDTSQESTSSAFSSALSETGENMGLTQGELEIITGTAYAIATAINIANINLVGSDLIWLITTILGSEEGTINFYELFANMPAPVDGEVPLEATITTNQSSELQSQTQAGADTGNNTGEGQTVEMNTGNATAVANTVNLTNLNLVGSRGLFAVINIVGSLLGDIILPNGSHLLPSNFPWGNTEVITNQQADIDSSSEATGNTGENTLEGSGEIITGNAIAISNTQSFANLVRVGDGWALLIFNLFGSWNGSLLNWQEPGSQETLGYGTHTLEQEWEGSLPEGSEDTGGSLTVLTNQNASVQSTTGANSNTGMNYLRGLGRLSTSNAMSLANDFTLANFVGVGSSFMFGIFNVVGNWVGNLVVAYPDLEVSITDGVDSLNPGSSSEYTVTVANNGDAGADNVFLDLSFSGEYVPNPGPLNWEVGDLKPGETKTFNIGGSVSPTALANTTIGATASVSTQETEESSSNNSAIDLTLIVIPPLQASEGSGKDTRLPDLKISVRNNVNDFVYPGDTVLAFITVANQSPFPARDVRVLGSLSNDHPMPPIPMSWKLGDLKPGERVKIEFEIRLIDELPAGAYHLSAEAKGKSEAGEESSSGAVTSDFLLKLKYYVEKLTPDVLADEGQVLGVSTSDGGGHNFLIDNQKYFPYILVITVFAYFGILALRRKIDAKKF